MIRRCYNSYPERTFWLGAFSDYPRYFCPRELDRQDIFAEVACWLRQAFGISEIKLKAGTSIRHSFARLKKFSAKIEPSRVLP